MKSSTGCEEVRPEFRAKLEDIVACGQRQGFLTIRELGHLFPADATIEETRLLYDRLQALGISIRSEPVETPAARHDGLLSREEEVSLARTIRTGHQRRLTAALTCPRVVAFTIRAISQVLSGARRPWDVLADFEGSHPDEDAAESLERLRAVAETLSSNQLEIKRLLRGPPDPGQEARLTLVRDAMARDLCALDFREAFIDEMIRPLLAEASRVDRALGDVAALEKALDLPTSSLGGLEPLADATVRRLLQGTPPDREAREQAKRDLKKHKRIIRSASKRVNMAPKLLLRAALEIRAGEREAHEARKTLVQSNQRLVISIARRYPHPSLDFLDLVQEGNLGLMRAADRFDPDRGFRFGTYAAWWVRQSIGRLVAEQSSAVRIPPHVQESLHKLNRISRRLVLKTGREPQVEELAELLGKTPERVLEILAAGRRPVSTETHVGDDEDSAKLLDFLPDPSAGPEEQADRRVQQMVLQDAMLVLTERERQIIELRYKQGLTLQEVGEQFGITRERTRQLEAQALSKLRKRLRADLLRRLIHDDPINVGPPPSGSAQTPSRPGGRGIGQRSQRGRQGRRGR